MAKFDFPFELYFESAQDVPAPYHFEAKIECLSKNETIAQIRFLGREDFTEGDIIAQGLNPKSDWTWKGFLPEIWQNRIQQNLEKFQNKEPHLPDHISFFCAVDKNRNEYFPLNVDQRLEEFYNELMQAIFEMAGIEQGLFLGFQFKDDFGNSLKITGEVSFANLLFNYNINEREEVKTLRWVEIKKLMNHLFMGEFDADLAEEELKHSKSFSVYIGDGLWYTAGKSWSKPRAIKDYFDKLEFMLNKYFIND
ncbi:MAG: hypothetical protein RIR51_1084 [Bacteroidota bacterium]|jgi:hypothetical protein